MIFPELQEGPVAVKLPVCLQEFLPLHTYTSENAKTKVGKSRRWGQIFKDEIPWKEYNVSLIIRGKMIFDLDFTS